MLRAQQPVGANAAVATMVFKDSLGNTWQRKTTTQIRRKQSPPMDVFPQGDVKLPRLKSRTLNYPTLPAGDTVQVSVMNKTGVPFRTLQLSFGPDAQLLLRDTAAVQYRTVMKPGAQMQITLRAQPSLRVQTAFVKITRTPPARPDTLRSFRDSLIQLAKIPVDFFTNRQSVQLPDGTVVNTSWNGNIPAGKPGEVVRRARALTIIPGTSKRMQIQPRGSVRLKNFKNTTRSCTDFMQGDTLIFQVNALKNTSLGRVTLADQDGNVLNSQINPGASFSDTVVIRNEKTLTLTMTPKPAVRKKYADVSVWRIRASRADTFYTVTDSTFLLHETVQYDTLVVTLFDDSLLLAPIWNIEQSPYADFTVQFASRSPQLGELAFVTYWLGVGRPVIRAFSALDAAVPPEWSRPDVSPFLGALGFRHPLALTEPNSKEVLAVYTNADGRKSFRAGKLKSDNRLPMSKGPGYGIADRQELLKGSNRRNDANTGTETLTFYACFQNKSTVNTYPVAFKMAGFYLQNKTVIKDPPRLLKTQTSKEPLRK